MFNVVRCYAAVISLTGAVLFAAPALADETDPPSDFTVSGTVSAISDYRFRGLSQSAGDPAVQGALNVNHASGLYAGLWASSTNFANISPAADATYGKMELDIYAGWTGEIHSGVSADIGLLYYVYPDGSVGKANFAEPYVSLSATLGPVSAKAGLNYAWKQASLDFNGDGRSDDSLYLYGELSGSIPGTPVTLTAHAGHADGALSPNFATGKTLTYKGGWDYSLAASLSLTRNLSISATYVGVDGNALHDYSNDTVVAAIKLAF